MASASGALVKNWKMPSEKLATLHDHDTQAFDVEVDMARALISPDPNARPKHFSNFFEEDVFVFAIMMATASTVSTTHTRGLNTDLPPRHSFKASLLSTRQQLAET